MQEEIKKATEKAMALLLHKDRTRFELTDRLKKFGFSSEAINEAMAYVESFGYIDDLRYACNFVSFRRENKSAKEIIYKLREKGVSQEIIEQAMEEEYQGESDAICRLLEKRLKGRNVSELTREEKEKHMAYLCRKGYSFRAVQCALQSFDEG